MTLHHGHRAPTSWDELPATIQTYLTAHADRDVDRAISAFVADAVVTDEGRDHIGRDEIKAWLADSASSYTYTTEFIGAATVDATTVDVVQRLEGDFPGHVADLHFRFTMDGALVHRLVIEP